MLEIGKKAPEFKLPDQNGDIHALKDYRGKKVILYFYPKDNTSGCTLETLNFKEISKKVQKKGAVIIGVSKDSVQSHKNFETNHNLPFVLLSDEDTKVIQTYDVWVEKSMYGRKYMGVDRSTYLIDEKGVIIKTYQKVKPASHMKDVLEDL